MAEARLFMDLEPCPGCGHRGFAEPSKLVEHGDQLVVTCRGYCPRCGASRGFELVLGEARVPAGAWGNAAPSTLIDAGQWMAVADDLSSAIPGGPRGLSEAQRTRAREGLDRAIAALDEVLKFYGEGQDLPPRSAFFTLSGRELFIRDQRRFARERVAATIDAWRVLAAAFLRGDDTLPGVKVRTYHEAALYVQEHPCGRCGTPPKLEELKEKRTLTGATTAHVLYTGKCASCQNPLRYEMDGPQMWPSLPTFAYGGDEPSEAFTGAEWLAMADRNLAETTADPATLSPDAYFAANFKVNSAIAMLDEARKLKAASSADLEKRLEVLRARQARNAELKDAVVERSRATARPEPPKAASLTKESLAAHEQWLARGRTGTGRLEVANTSVGGLPLGNLQVSYAKLVRVDFTKATVDFARFIGTELVECTAENTNFSRSKFDDATLTDCEFGGAHLGMTDFKRTRIEGGDFRGVTPERGFWQGARLIKVDFRDARFGDCVLDEAVLEGCDLRGATFARIQKSLDLCTARRTVFRDCDLRGADFEGRRLDGTSFIRCKLAGVKGKPAIEGPYRVELPDFSVAGDGSDIRNSAALYALWGEPP